jgi:lysyl-tRNA synthetase class 2
MNLTCSGRVSSFRSAGSKLVFIDIFQEGHRVQGLLNFRELAANGVSLQEFKDFSRKLQRGDILRTCCIFPRS